VVIGLRLRGRVAPHGRRSRGPARRLGLGVVLPLLAVSLASIAPAQELATPEEGEARLQAIREQIERNKAEAAALGKKEQGVIANLNEIERSIDLTQDYIDELDRQIQARDQEIQGLSGQLARLEEELVVKRKILERRLRDIYKFGRYGAFQVLLMADSFASIVGRYKYLNLIARQDDRLFQRVKVLKGEIEQHRHALQQVRGLMDERRGERVSQVAALKAGEEERARVLRSIKSEKGKRVEAARDLEKESERIQALLASLEKVRKDEEDRERRAAEAAGRPAPAPETSILTSAYGKLDWPVQGEIIEGFGRSVHPIYGTTVINNGIDIRAPRGTPIKAVEAGTVQFVDWYGAYGKTVILDHKGGHYSIYSHLEDVNVKPGQSVAHGAVIGTVGDTGSLDGPKLHFEIRKGGRAVDPITWLRKR
jgi:septal ring factor EnvC (AmiA/AmiB activator)